MVQMEVRGADLGDISMLCAGTGTFCWWGWGGGGGLRIAVCPTNH